MCLPWQRGIHLHEIVELASQLPLPANALYDQFVVNITELPPPRCSTEHLHWCGPSSCYSYNPGGTLTFPIQYVAHSASMRGQNATYTGHGADIVETMFTGTLTRRRTRLGAD